MNRILEAVYAEYGRLPCLRQILGTWSDVARALVVRRLVLKDFDPSGKIARQYLKELAAERKREKAAVK